MVACPSVVRKITLPNDNTTFRVPRFRFTSYKAANVYTHLSLKDTAADVERLPAIPTAGLGQMRATGTDSRVLSKSLAKSEMSKRVNSSYIRAGGNPNQSGQETPKAPVLTEAFSRVDEGTRTPNPWNHNPVL